MEGVVKGQVELVTGLFKGMPESRAGHDGGLQFIFQELPESQAFGQVSIKKGLIASVNDLFSAEQTRKCQCAVWV